MSLVATALLFELRYQEALRAYALQQDPYFPQWIYPRARFLPLTFTGGGK